MRYCLETATSCNAMLWAGTGGRAGAPAAKPREAPVSAFFCIDANERKTCSSVVWLRL